MNEREVLREIFKFCIAGACAVKLRLGLRDLLCFALLPLALPFIESALNGCGDPPVRKVE